MHKYWCMVPGGKLPTVVIHPGEQFVESEPVIMSTLLGSCVAACLWDPVAKIAGMNHFLLAHQRYAKNMPLTITEAGRYGVHAMELLINEMLKKGALKARLQAKAYGGAALLGLDAQDNYGCVGEVNVRFILEFLKTEGIPLVEADLGGRQGRTIKFRTDTWEVQIKPIQSTILASVDKKEHSFWDKSLIEHKTKPGTVVLFDHPGQN